MKTNNIDTEWQKSVVYQVYPRSFSDSNGDGIGDLGGIIERLDYLAALGVDVIWLSPIYRSPQDDNGYDISDYQDIDPSFGTLEQFDQLLAEAHARGLEIIMDLVVNHTSDEHPWFIESSSSKDSPKRDWYWWYPPRPGATGGTPGAEPTNWGSYFAGPTWTWDENTSEYYLHLFAPKQPELNWENPEVRAAVYEMMNWWLDRGVDGFRMDVINLISKVLPLTDGERPEGTLWGDKNPSTVCGPRVHEFLQEMHREVFAKRPRHHLTVGETPSTTSAEARLFSDPERKELDMIFQFEHVGLGAETGGKYAMNPVPLPDLKRNLAHWQEALAKTGWNAQYWDNHDQPRAVSRFGDDTEPWRELSAKALGTVLHMHRGTPYIYQGEELGMTNTKFHSIEEHQDIETLGHYHEAVANGADPEEMLAAVALMNRDNARTPMHWDSGVNAGFTTGTPWLKINPNHISINAAAQVEDPTSVFSHYRELIKLRHTNDTVVHGDFRLLAPDHPALWAFIRSGAEGDLLTLANFSREPIRLDLGSEITGFADGKIILSNYATPGDPLKELRGWEAVIIQK